MLKQIIPVSLSFLLSVFTFSASADELDKFSFIALGDTAYKEDRHGDFHKFVIDRPFLKHGGNHNPKDLSLTNFTRLQVYGDPEDKAVKITVDPNSKHVFGFIPVY